MDQTPLFDIKVDIVYVHHSERVNSVDLHPTEHWILVGLDSGNVAIWDYQAKIEVKSFKVCQSPVRSAKFIARENQIVAAGDDKIIYVYDYNNNNKLVGFEAHTDIIRSVVVHPKLPRVISAADDNVVKAWNWEGAWHCIGTFQGHSNYVMQVAFHPTNTDAFASASLDYTLKVWNLNSSSATFTLHGHSKGVKCVDYFMNNNNNKLYLLSGSDDFTAKVWDYEAKLCVKTLLGHENNVTAVGYHPKLPIIITASEDTTVKIWDAVTYELKTSLNFELGKVWSIGYKKASYELAFGCDKGFIVVKMTDQSGL